jgi:hypothetical protein
MLSLRKSDIMSAMDTPDSSSMRHTSTAQDSPLGVRSYRVFLDPLSLGILNSSPFSSIRSSLSAMRGLVLTAL